MRKSTKPDRKDKKNSEENLNNFLEFGMEIGYFKFSQIKNDVILYNKNDKIKNLIIKNNYVEIGKTKFCIFDDLTEEIKTEIKNEIKL
jgi:hypothetical protein